MLDLKKLEEKLDKVLNSETTESLENWIGQKRSLSDQSSHSYNSLLQQSLESFLSLSHTTFVSNTETVVVATVKSIEPKAVEDNSISGDPEFNWAA